MEDIALYYYDLLSQKVKMNITKNGYKKSIKIAEKYLSCYDFYLEKGKWDDEFKCYCIPLYLSDECYGIIKLSNNSISVAVNKEISEYNFGMTEYLTIAGDKYHGCYVNFVPNLSSTNIIVDDVDMNSFGAVVETKFNEKGIINHSTGEILEYESDNDNDKIGEAYCNHIMALSEQLERFMTFEDLNICSVKIHTLKKDQ
ncbi:MAG: hypothetical protein IKN87_01590 [Bacilli bacterium]|nr:hypothetical protein [Bacilli bacterium]